MDVDTEKVQFEDDFEVMDKDPDGKKFDRGESFFLFFLPLPLCSLRAQGTAPTPTIERERERRQREGERRERERVISGIAFVSQ